MNKFYGAHDQWTDLDKQNDVLITSTDGVIDSVKVNGEDYGGGGGSSDFSTATVVFNNISESDPASVNVANVASSEDSPYTDYYVSCPAGETTATIVLTGIGAVAVLSVPDELMFVNATGDVTIFGSDTLQITGDGTVTIEEKIK